MGILQAIVLRFISERVAKPMVRFPLKENRDGHLTHRKQGKYLFLKHAQEGHATLFVRGADFLHFLSSELEATKLLEETLQLRPGYFLHMELCIC